MVGHADEATTAQARLPPGPVPEAHRPGEERVANVVLVAVLEQLDVAQADRVIALDPQLEHEPVGQVDEILVEHGTPAHHRRLSVVAAVRVRPRVMGAARVLPLGRAARAEVAVAGRGQGLAQALLVGLEVVVGEDRLVGALEAHRASASRNRSTSSIESSTNAADVPRPPTLRIIGLADEDADALAGERPEGVLVGDVVAQVQRRDVVAVQSERL